MSIEPTSLPFDLYSQLSLNLKPKRHDEARFALLIVQIHRASFLNEPDTLHVSSTLKEKICLNYLLFSELQEGLKRKSDASALKTGKYMSSFLKKQRICSSLVKPLQCFEQQVRLSFSILPFPYQQGYLMDSIYRDVCLVWEKMQIDAANYLFNYFKDPVSVENAHIIGLHRLLFFHYAIYENGKWVNWLQILADWAQQDPERFKSITNLLNCFKHIFSPCIFPEASQQESTYALPLSFHDYVIDRTARCISAQLDMKFHNEFLSVLKNAMLEEDIRLDLLYFVAHKEKLKECQFPFNRPSQSLLLRFYLLTLLPGGHYREKNPAIAACLNFDYINCGLDVYLHLLPSHNENLFSNVSLLSDSLLQIESFPIESRADQLAPYLMTIFEKYKDFFTQTVDVLSPIEMIRFLSTDASKKLSLFQEFDKNLQKENKYFCKKSYHGIPEQKSLICYFFLRLFMEKKEIYFARNCTFLTSLQTYFNIQFDAERVFHFLMSEIEIHDAHIYNLDRIITNYTHFISIKHDKQICKLVLTSIVTILKKSDFKDQLQAEEWLALIHNLAAKAKIDLPENIKIEEAFTEDEDSEEILF